MSELKQKAIHGIRWSIVSSLFVGIGGLLQLLLLARVFSREEMGLVGIVNIVVGFSIQLADMGFSNALLREYKVSELQKNSLFALNIALSTLSAFFCFFASSFLSDFYDQISLSTLIKTLSPALLFGGLSLFHQTLLQRSLQFKNLAISEILSFIIGFSVTTYLAISNTGVISVCIGLVAKNASMFFLFWYFGRNEHSVKIEFSKSSVNPFWRLGYLQTGERFLNYLSLYFDNIIIGKALGMEALGLYEVSKRLLIQPIYVLNPLITKVSYPIMAKVNQDTDRLRNIAIRSVQLAVTINAPIYWASFIGASIIVPTVFGLQWVAGIEIFRWMAICFFIRAVMNPFGGIILAKGKIEYGIYFQISILISVLCTAIFGKYYGLSQILILMASSYVVLFSGFYYWAIKPILSMKFLQIFDKVWIELLLAFLSFTFSFIVSPKTALGWLDLGLFFTCGMVLYSAGILLFRKETRRDLFETLVQKKTEH